MRTWNCDAFERWLDDGCPEQARRPAEAHAQACVRCREALAAAEAVERGLRQREPSPRAPEGFTEAVMRRVSAAGSADAEPAVRAESLLGWLLADPATMAACAFALLLLWWRTPLWALAVAASRRVVALAPAPSALAVTGAVDSFASPGAAAGLCIALLSLVVFGSYLLMGWSQRMTARS